MRKIIIMTALSLSLVSCGQADRSYPTPVPAAPRGDLPVLPVTEWVTNGTYGYRIGRFHDEQNGATCWVVAGAYSNPNAISCIPDNHLKEK